MTEPARHPTFLLRAISAAVRGLLWLALLAWLAFTVVWGSLHGWIVPRIEEFRPRIESESSRLLGVPVRIGSISARTVGLVPSFDLKQVNLLDNAGRVALSLPLVSVAVSPRSLLSLGFEQLYIDKPEVEIRRTAQGRVLVAGIDFSAPGSGDELAQDWFFSQKEVVILGGKVRWVDEQRGAPELVLSDLNFVARNGVRTHQLRIDASPPAEWGERFTLMGSFRESLTAFRRRVWQDWEGVAFASFTRVDVSRLRQYADLGVEVNQGLGAVRVWSDWTRGEIGAVTADVALDQVNIRLAEDLKPLALRALGGRISGRRLPGGLEFATQDLRFQTDDGIEWPGGNVSFRRLEAPGRAAESELKADRLDLSALSRIAGRLPLDEGIHAALLTHEPRGMVESLQAQWQGSLTSPQRYDIKATVKALELTARAGTPATTEPVYGIPGLRGVDVDFSANQAGGSASLSLVNGALVFPGVFDDPSLLFDRLAAKVNWKTNGDALSVQIPQLQFMNKDGEGELQASWRTADAPPGRPQRRFPGVLDLRATIARAEGVQVHRYLPTVVDREARDYVRQAVQGGRASEGRVRIKGDLNDLPFEDPRKGEFRISANVRDATFAYVPRAYAAQATDEWPALTQLSGELIFERAGMLVRVASGRVVGKPGLQIARTSATIPNLGQAPVLAVSGDIRGPLTDMLAVVAETPVAQWTSNVLARASATGSADARLQLSLPLNALESARVSGSVSLNGNDVQIVPDSPMLARTRGVVQFSETSVSFSNVQARVYGGDVRLEGATRPAAVGASVPGSRAEPVLVVRAQGVAQAEALRGAEELGMVPQLARHASGATSYSAALTMGRSGTEINVTSSLKGLALNLPAPLRKEADEVLNLRYENLLMAQGTSATAGRNGATQEERMALDLGPRFAMRLHRDLSGPSARLLRGNVQIGAVPVEPSSMPESGLGLNLRLDRLDVDAWLAVLGGPSQVAAKPGGLGLTERTELLPTMWAIQAGEVVFQGRSVHDLAARGTREGSLWRSNIEARELSGYAEFRQGAGATPGRLFARLARLSLAPADVTDFESLLDQEQQSMPAMDVTVESLDLRGRKLGRVEIDAVNRAADALSGTAREWRLNRLNVILPEANFTANGNWAAVGAQAASRSTRPGASLAGQTGRRAQRTVMNFKLDVADSGELLARFGMKDVVRRGKGKLEGQVAWLGSPLQMDYASLGGQFTASFESGQFLKADPGIAKLLGVLSLQSLPRRLVLDFRDVFAEGFAFDFVRGDVQIEQGIARTNNLQMKGISAAVLLEGRADIARETQDISVVVVPEINAGTLSLVASAINPAIGIGSFLAQLFLRRPLIQASTQEFRIDGSWADPQVTRVQRGPPAAQPGGAAPSESN